MNMVGRVGSFITQGMYSVATPFHPFGGAVDIIVVKQHDGTYRSTPWYVRFGKFQGVLKGAEKLVKIEVNGVEADFHMHLNNSGEACFVREVDPDKDVDLENENTDLGMARLERAESDSDRIFYEFQDDQEEFSEYGSSTCDNVDGTGNVLESQDSNSEVVLVSVDGHMLKARLSSSERNAEDLQLNTPQFHLGPAKGTEEFSSVEATLGDDFLSDLYSSEHECTAENVSKKLHHAHETEADNQDSSPESISNSSRKADVFKSCLELPELVMQSKEGEQEAVNKVQIGGISPACEENCSEIKEVGCHNGALIENIRSDLFPGLEISLCGNLLYPGMSSSAAEEVFDTNLISSEEYRLSAPYIVQNENLIVRVQRKYYLPWDKAAHIVLGKAAFGLDLSIDPHDTIPLKQDRPEAKEDDDSGMVSTPSRRWRLWPIPFRRAKSLQHSHSTLSNDEFFVDSESLLESVASTPSPRVSTESPRKKILRTNLPTTDQIALLNLIDGQNMVKFIFSTRVLGIQKVEAHIYLWKWNTRIVISDVDGTITKSDVLGQFMPLVGRDWSHSGIARLFSAIKENGYQLLFLSARAIVQSYLTKSFLFNLKQDGNSLPNGPVVISPDGLFPSLYREVIRRAPHEFKIACLEDIKALFPPDYNPFYAGFGNRDTDELSYRKMGIPKGKIFIINPKGEVAINRRNDVKSYTSLHTLVHDMFPPTSLANEMLSPTSLVEQEDYNSWNFWKMPLPDIDKF